MTPHGVRVPWMTVVQLLLAAMFGSVACHAQVPSEDASLERTPATFASTAAASATERTEYRDLVTLSDVSAHRGSGAVDGMAVVEGELKNTGDRSLEQVTLAIFFLNAQGRTVKRETYSPVERLTVPGDLPPLKPNEVREWSCGVGDIPESWTGSVDVKVAAVEFSSGEK